MLKKMQAEEKNVGISLLRLMCIYLVIFLHTKARLGGGKNGYELIGVPCFMFLSFFLCNRIYYSREAKSLRRRIVRLGAPLVFWNVVYYIFYVIADQTYVDWRQLFYGILFGHATELNQPLWYLTTQLIITIIAFVIYYVTDNDFWAEKILIGIAALCIILQYSGMNLYLFGSCVGEIGYTFGFLAELMPAAVAGLILGRTSKHTVSIIVMIAASVITYLFPQISGFGYQGIHLTCVSVTMCLIMITLGEKIRLGYFNRIINQLAKYTMGVYCLHWLVLKYLTIFYEKNALLFSKRIVFEIYVISLLFAFGLEIIAKRVKWLANMVS